MTSIDSYPQGQALLLIAYLELNQGMEKNMETTLRGYIRTTIRIHSFIPS